jgi:antitoxin VapB
MGAHRTAKLFTHGGSQAVRLPKEFRFAGGEVRIRKEGDRVILEPVERDWDAFWARMDQLAEEAGEPFPYPPRDQPAPPPKANFDD